MLFFFPSNNAAQAHTKKWYIKCIHGKTIQNISVLGHIHTALLNYLHKVGNYGIPGCSYI